MRQPKKNPILMVPNFKTVLKFMKKLNSPFAMMLPEILTILFPTFHEVEF
jgi:hypothetical protein